MQERKGRTLTVEEVQEVVRQGAAQFPKERWRSGGILRQNLFHRLNRLPDLKFKYVEEEEPEEFFIPYVWTLATEVIWIFLLSKYSQMRVPHFSACTGVGRLWDYFPIEKSCDKNLHTQAFSFGAYFWWNVFIPVLCLKICKLLMCQCIARLKIFQYWRWLVRVHITCRINGDREDFTLDFNKI